ncbi:hypothetical protein TRVA0_011S02146 [Trichomonascus vanleenenianus]|uniref:uncharacterized protein n=1 Tax=Trichomonascus vanleenenianus TaxID=2268995 RepID=UPI003EC98AE3
MKLSTVVTIALAGLIQGVHAGAEGEQLAAEGNGLLVAGDLSGALAAYSSAVRLEPDNYLYLYKRAAAYLSLGREKSALDDLNRVLTLAPGFENALEHRGRVYLRQGKLEEALADLEALGAPTKAVGDVKVSWNQAEKALNESRYGECAEYATGALDHSPHCYALRRLRAQCQLANGRVSSALVDLSAMEQLNPSDVGAYATSAEIYFYSLGDYERATSQIQRCLRVDQESRECRAANKRIRKGHKQLATLLSGRATKVAGHATWRQLTELLIDEGGYERLRSEREEAFRNAGIEVSPSSKSELDATLEDALCEAYYNQKQYSEGQLWCERVLERAPEHVVAVLLTAQVLVEAEEYDAAVERLKPLSGSGDARVRNKLREVQALASQEKNYYRILGVARDATSQDIKRAYRTKSKEFHPDKYRGELTEEQVQKKMQDINEAYETLSNDESRRNYDMGGSSGGGGGMRRGPQFGTDFTQYGHFDFGAFQDMFKDQRHQHQQFFHQRFR